MKIGRKVDGIATMKELRNPRHIGVVGSVKAVWKFCNVGLKGFVTHHPFKISVTGRIEVMKTPRNGKSQSRPIPTQSHGLRPSVPGSWVFGGDLVRWPSCLEHASLRFRSSPKASHGPLETARVLAFSNDDSLEHPSGDEKREPGEERRHHRRVVEVTRHERITEHLKREDVRGSSDAPVRVRCGEHDVEEFQLP